MLEAVSCCYVIDPVFCEFWPTHGAASKALPDIRESLADFIEYQKASFVVRYHYDTKLWFIVCERAGRNDFFIDRLRL